MCRTLFAGCDGCLFCFKHAGELVHALGQAGFLLTQRAQCVLQPFNFGFLGLESLTDGFCLGLEGVLLDVEVAQRDWRCVVLSCIVAR